MEERQPGVVYESASFRLHRTRWRKVIDQEVYDQCSGNEVEHYCGDDHMAAPLGLQVAGDESPSRAEGGGGYDCQQNDGSRRESVEVEAYQRNAEASHVGLTLRANVEQAGMIRHGKGKAGENEIGRVEQSIANALAIKKCALDNYRGGLERVLSYGKQD